jgi:protein-S-isoprenylcysteine O-methyltransferase Ste14
METFRYYLALFLTGSVPAILAYLLLLHSLIGIWRRIGVVASQIFLWTAVLGVFLWVISATRDFALADFGPNPIFFNAGMVCLAMAVWLRLKVSRSIGWRALLGLPEIAPKSYPQRLVTTGPYARVRHPRYLQAFLALIGWALIANHPASYLACSFWIPGIWLVVALEEQELAERFGAEFEAYQKRVPKFFALRRERFEEKTARDFTERRAG